MISQCQSFVLTVLRHLSRHKQVDQLTHTHTHTHIVCSNLHFLLVPLSHASEILADNPRKSQTRKYGVANYRLSVLSYLKDPMVMDDIYKYDNKGRATTLAVNWGTLESYIIPMRYTQGKPNVMRPYPRLNSKTVTPSMMFFTLLEFHADVHLHLQLM